jgi:hypothetical protein
VNAGGSPTPLSPTVSLPCPHGCDHPLTVHSVPLGCWLCDCTYGRPVTGAAADAGEWTCEPGDPSVGIFGPAWYHEVCPAPDAEGAEATVQIVVTGSEGCGVDRFAVLAYTVTCPGCGRVLRFGEREWDPDDIGADRGAGL